MMIYVAHFFAAFLLVNCIPHFVQGVSGNPFQSPFASPPGRRGVIGCNKRVVGLCQCSDRVLFIV